MVHVDVIFAIMLFTGSILSGNTSPLWGILGPIRRIDDGHQNEAFKDTGHQPLPRPVAALHEPQHETDPSSAPTPLKSDQESPTSVSNQSPSLEKPITEPNQPTQEKPQKQPSEPNAEEKPIEGQSQEKEKGTENTPVKENPVDAIDPQPITVTQPVLPQPIKPSETQPVPSEEPQPIQSAEPQPIKPTETQGPSTEPQPMQPVEPQPIEPTETQPVSSTEPQPIHPIAPQPIYPPESAPPPTITSVGFPEKQSPIAEEFVKPTAVGPPDEATSSGKVSCYYTVDNSTGKSILILKCAFPKTLPQINEFSLT